MPVPIAFVLTSFESGGTERQMVELVCRLDPDRWRVHLACLHARGACLDRARSAAVSLTEFPVRSFRRPETVRQALAFAAWCRANRIAVVHTADFYANVFALPPAAAAGVPVRIGNRREINPDKSAAQILLQRAAYAFANRVVANSRAAAARLRRERVPAARIALVANGLDAQIFHPAPPRPVRRRVAVVANLRPEKGHDVLVDAAALVLRRVPDARFDVVGTGPEFARVRARAEAAGVAGAFTFFGYQDDVAGRLRTADVFALPSRSEAMPNAVLEAMSTALPVVASAVDGLLELVDDNQTGLLVPPGDPAALANALVRVMSDRALADRLGQAARRAITARHTFDRMVLGFERIYGDELARHGLPVAELAEAAAS